MKRFEDKCVYLEDFSENIHSEIEDGICSVLFIDGNHSFEAVTLDLKNYVPKVKNGGLVIGDDYNEEGVDRAIKEYVKETNINFKVEQIGGKTSKFWFVV